MTPELSFQKLRWENEILWKQILRKSFDLWMDRQLCNLTFSSNKPSVLKIWVNEPNTIVSNKNIFILLSYNIYHLSASSTLSWPGTHLTLVSWGLLCTGAAWSVCHWGWDWHGSGESCCHCRHSVTEQKLKYCWYCIWVKWLSK